MMWRRMEIFSEKSKIGPKAYNTAYSQVVTQPSTDAAQQVLTSVIGRERFSLSKKGSESFFIYKSLNVMFNTFMFIR